MIVPCTPAVVFIGTNARSFELTLTGDVLSSTTQGMIPGVRYSFLVQQDGVGGHAFTPPPTMPDFPPVPQSPNGRVVIVMLGRMDGNLYATNFGTISEG